MSVTTGLGHTEGDNYREYVTAGKRLLEQGTLTSPLIVTRATDTPSALMPPGFAAWVASVYGLCGVESQTATALLQIINALSTAIATLLVYSITRRMAGEVAGWGAAALAGVNPALIGFTTYIWDTNLFALGVTLGVYFAFRLGQSRPGWIGWLGFGAYLGVLALLNPALTVAYPLLVLWPATRVYGWHVRSLVRPAFLALFGWLIAITPWTVRNYIHFHKLIYVRSGLMLELWLGVCPEADMHGAAVYKERFPLLNQEVQDHVVATGEGAYLAECREKALDAIESDPWRFVRLMGLRVVDYWGGTVYTHARPGEGGWPRSWSRAVVAGFLSLEVALVLGGLVTRLKRSADFWWLLAVVLLFSLVYVITHVQIRFRAPVEPIMAILAVLAFLEPHRKTAGGRLLPAHLET